MGPAIVPVGKRGTDEEFDVLEMIKDGRYVDVMLDDGDLVQALAAHGHSIETVADAIDRTVEEVEALADKERIELAEKLEAVRIDNG